MNRKGIAGASLLANGLRSVPLLHALSLACLLTALLVLSLTGCTQPADDVIRFGLSSAPANLDPRFATDAASVRINRLLYERLVDFDEHSRPIPSLASWEALSPVHYRFTLRPGVHRFHDGQPLSADDVAATYRFILDPANASPHRSTLQLIERVAVIDARTLDFHIKRTDPLFPGFAVMGILPAEGIRNAHPFHEKPLGSGPFAFAGWPEPGRLCLTRLADGQRFEFLRIGDPTVRVLKLLRGEIDLLQNDLSAEMLAYLGSRNGIKLMRRPGSNFSYLGFNLQDPVTGQPSVRRAIAHAIDRQSIIRYLLGGGARTAAALLPSGHWAGNPALVPPAHDPQLARKLLEQAGYDREHPLRLQYKTSTDPLRVRIATVIQQQLRAVGIEMTLSSYDWGTFYGDIKAGRFQLYSLAWVGIKTPDIFRYAFHSRSLPPQGANRGRLADARTDALIEAAENAPTLAGQARAWRQVQARLLQLLPYIPLWYEDHVVAVREGLAGYRLAGDGNYDGLRFVTRTGD
ncbi:MAG: ABC transporter substrate-binding protein [Gammaproteobacteria bacterium]|jgi:peptide/nickel transport system substrate-binding protein